MADYPNSIVSYTTISATDKQNAPSHSARHNSEADEIVAIETIVGTTPQGAYSTVSDRIAALETSVADDKVKVDTAATADYIGAASGDGVLRTGTGLSYTDGGNFVTLAVDADYTDISANDAATDISGAELETLSDGSNADALHTHASITDDKVKIDAAATADYIGAASSDGVLRVTTTNGLTYTDGGNFVTLAFDADYTDISGNDAATDITGAELEELSDGSSTALHTHATGSSIQNVEVVKNSGAVVSTRPQLNFIEGANVTLTIADDAGNGQADITIASSAAGSSLVRATFTNASLVAGVLTITHSGSLSAPFTMMVTIFDNNGVKIEPDSVTGATNSVAIDLTSFGTLTGTWGYAYII